MIDTNFTNANRASAFNISYILAISMTAVILVGVSVSVGGLLKSQQAQVIDDQLTVVGDQASNTVMMVDRAGNMGSNTTFNQTYMLPENDVLRSYEVYLLSHNGEQFIYVQTVNGDYVYTSKIQVSAVIEESGVRGGQDIQVIYETNPDTGHGTLRLHAETTVDPSQADLDS